MSDADETAAKSPSSNPDAGRSRSILGLVVLIFIAINVAVLVRACTKTPERMADAAGRVLEKAGQAIANVVSAFTAGKVTTEFISYATSIQPTHRLQFATLKQTEIFTRTDERTTGFGYIPLPDVIVEARAPVEFTYYLDLNAQWNLVLVDNVIYVKAPRIQFNQPAVDVSAMKYELRKGSVFRNTTDSMNGLKDSITQLANQRARENLPIVRETGRRQTQEFVEKWLSHQFTDGKNYPVKVYFEGEKLPAALQGVSNVGVTNGSNIVILPEQR